MLLEFDRNFLVKLIGSFQLHIHFHTSSFKKDLQLKNGNSGANTLSSTHSNESTRRKSTCVSPERPGFKSGFAEVGQET